MMVLLQLISLENGFVTYEYSRSNGEKIGTVTVEIANKENVSFEFYPESEIKKFCTFTAYTIGTIYKFIRENNFPDKYTYASG